VTPEKIAEEDLTCDSCPVAKRCRWFGSSPMQWPEGGGEARCVPVAFGSSTLGVLMPAGLDIDPKTGEVAGVKVELRWVRYRARFRAWLRRLFTGGRRV